MGMPLRYEEILARRYSGQAIRLVICDLLWCHKSMRALFGSVGEARQKIMGRIDFERWLRVFAPRAPCRIYRVDRLKRRVFDFIGRLWDLDALASNADGKLGFWEIFNLLPFEVFCFELAEVVHNRLVDLGAYCSPEKVEFEAAAEKWADSMGCEELAEEPRAARVLAEWSTRIRAVDKVFVPKRLSRIDRVLLYSHFLGLPSRFQANSERLRIQRLKQAEDRWEESRRMCNEHVPANIAQQLRRDLNTGQRRRMRRRRGFIAHNKA